MTAQTGLFVARDAGGNGTTAKGARQALAGLLAKNSDGTVRTGVLLDGQGPVVTGAAGMTYNVRKHVAVTKATEANGPVLVPNDGAVSVTTDPAPGSNSRIDVIYVLQPLVTGDGGSSTTVTSVIDVVKGTAAASPSVPAIPTGALELARVTVPSGTTATSGLTFTQGAVTWTGGGIVRHFMQAQNDAGYTNTAAIGTLAIPAVAVATRLRVSTVGRIGFAAAPGNFALNLTSSAGTVTDVMGNKTVRAGEASQWYLYSKTMFVDLPANTATNIVTTFSTPGTGGWWGGLLEVDVFLPGEY